MSEKPRNRLFDIDIDEVSTVDRPANQLGLISIAKAAGAEGDVADYEQVEFAIPDDVEHGDTIIDEEGTEYIYLDTDEAGDPLPLDGVDTDALLAEAEQVFDLSDGEGGGDEDEDVGKAAMGRLFGIGRQAALQGRETSGAAGQALSTKAGRAVGGAEKWVKKNPWKAGGITAAAGLGAGGAVMTASKSLGTQVLEELSKAVTDEERNQIVAKMAEDQAQLAAENEELRKAFEQEQDARLTEMFISKAAEYELPVDPAVFGPILKAIVDVLDEDELEVLDVVLSAKGVPLDEIGYTGGASNSGVLDEVSGLAAELVGKAAGGVSTEQATTALFEHNPSAYDAYLAEQDGR